MQTNVGVRLPPTRKIEPFWASAAALLGKSGVAQTFLVSWGGNTLNQHWRLVDLGVHAALPTSDSRC